MPHLFLTSITASTTPATALLAAAAKSTKSTSSSSSSLLFLVVILFLGFYLLFLRPRQQKARAARQGAGKTLSIGDEVVTIGGILGIVSAVDADSITVEVAPGTHMSFLRRAVNLRASVAGAPRGVPVTTPAEDADDQGAYDDEGTYDDDATYDEGWEDEEAAGEEAPEGDGLDGGGTGTAGETGGGHITDPGGKGEGR